MSCIIPDEKTDGRWLKSRRISGELFVTVTAAVWYSMRRRCIKGGNYQSENVTYVGCTTSEEFADFQLFAEWYTAQKGYNLNYSLDKDLLSGDSKVYSVTTCVLIPQALNAFIADHRRGKHRPGVTYNVKAKKFVAKVRTEDRRIILGNFASEDEAAEAYIEAKVSETARWITRLEAGEFDVDSRVVEALRQIDWRKRLTEGK